jgi:hypothetical protein
MILDEQGQRDMWLEIEIMEGHHEHWVAQYVGLGLANELRVANVAEESRTMMKQIFEPMAQRINHLHGQVFLQNKVDSPYAIINVSTSTFDFTIIEGGYFYS